MKKLRLVFLWVVIILPLHGIQPLSQQRCRVDASWEKVFEFPQKGKHTTFVFDRKFLMQKGKKQGLAPEYVDYLFQSESVKKLEGLELSKLEIWHNTCDTRLNQVRPRFVQRVVQRVQQPAGGQPSKKRQIIEMALWGGGIASSFLLPNPYGYLVGMGAPSVFSLFSGGSRKQTLSFKPKEMRGRRKKRNEKWLDEFF